MVKAIGGVLYVGGKAVGTVSSATFEVQIPHEGDAAPLVSKRRPANCNPAIRFEAVVSNWNKGMISRLHMIGLTPYDYWVSAHGFKRGFTPPKGAMMRRAKERKRGLLCLAGKNTKGYH